MIKKVNRAPDLLHGKQGYRPRGSGRMLIRLGREANSLWGNNYLVFSMQHRICLGLYSFSLDTFSLVVLTGLQAGLMEWFARLSRRNAKKKDRLMGNMRPLFPYRRGSNASKQQAAQAKDSELGRYGVPLVAILSFDLSRY